MPPKPSVEHISSIAENNTNINGEQGSNYKTTGKIGHS